MNHHRHPPHARAEKRLSLEKEVEDKRGAEERKLFTNARGERVFCVSLTHSITGCGGSCNYILSLKISNLSTEN